MQNNAVFPTKFQDQQTNQEKLVNWLIKKIEAVKKELEYKVSKCLK